MAANPNTQSLKQHWMDQYQITHYKQPVYRAIADEKQFTAKLKKGDTINWAYMSDFYVEDMGADGSYNTQAQTDTNETLTINKTKDVSFYEFEKDLEQAHYSVKADYARKAMNKVFLQIDADVLYNAYTGAANILDNGNLTGGAVSGVPVTVSVTNIDALFVISNQILQLTNVIYDPNITFNKEVKLEKVTGMPVSLISAQVYSQLILRLGGKTTVLGDKVSVSGHAGAFMGFNLFVTNQLTSTVAINLTTQPNDGDTFTINGFTFTFKTTLGVTAGNILIGGSAAAAQTNLIAAFAAPFTTTANYVTQTDNITNRLKLANLVCSAFSSSLATISQAGIGSMVVTIGQFVASNTIGGTILSGAVVGGTLGAGGTVTVIQHNVFGVSRSVSIAIQKYPTLYVNPVSGKVGKDYVTWTYYGIKVFKHQTVGLIDVQVNASSFQQATVLAN